MSGSLKIDPSAQISDTARITASTRGSTISIGAHTEIYDYVVIKPVGGSGDITIGEYCFLNPHTVLYSGNGITLGNYVLIAPGCAVVPTNHAFSRRDIPIRKQGFAPSKGGVVIEDDVWIGANSTILDGARIGKGAIIGAGSVVAGVVGPYEVWAGAPARFIEKRP